MNVKQVGPRWGSGQVLLIWWRALGGTYVKKTHQHLKVPRSKNQQEHNTLAMAMNRFEQHDIHLPRKLINRLLMTIVTIVCLHYKLPNLPYWVNFCWMAKTTFSHQSSGLQLRTSASGNGPNETPCCETNQGPESIQAISESKLFFSELNSTDSQKS